VGDDRQHGGNDGYDDDPSAHYSWDSTVPNHYAVKEGDVIALWDKKQLLGASVIDTIEPGTGRKTLSSCAYCGRATIKPRKTRKPIYKCYTCKREFDQPRTREVDVETYRTQHDVGWVDLSGTLSGGDLRALCVDPKSQLSLRPLRWDAFAGQLMDRFPDAGRLTVVSSRSDQLAGGHRTRTVRVRIGQAQFRKKLLETYGSECAFTGPTPAAVLEACHLYSYSKTSEHHIQGGLLLRRDVHRLFDLGFLAVDPESLRIDVSQIVLAYPAYRDFQGKRLTTELTPSQCRWLQAHWAEHRLSGGGARA
jgi:hypothetical protein